MTLQEIYDLAIEMGIKADPRGAERVKKLLSRTKKEYEELALAKKKFFDLESLRNPYSDTRILTGSGKTKVKKVLAGIDIDVGEVLLADRLNQKGKGIDLLIGHHPHGAALASLDEVMDLQVDLMASFGVSVNVAEALLKERISQVKRRLGPANHFQSVDAARLLEIPFLVIHTVWDNLGCDFISNYLKKKDLETVGEVLEALENLPEFEEAKRGKAGPRITSGNEKNRAGKVVVSGFTGGTEGSKLMYEKLAQAGVGTIVEMHMSEEHFEEAKKHHLNVIVSGHMASDSIGANIFLDALERKGIAVIPCSGLIRVRRNK
ncbi:MAG: NGG1p interacting factor NIF3 [Candidatus Levybacteria bacterium]|nr:NGG1p interacting factor NIF3 [Candidatus Levybacteria bacterium]MBI2190173.1 NGG1p interacting factor NIF3 [Candidatus Levybacteria bacterium]MBI3069983.1 NGG1p interacting factor NIF3 [Candidatus Levybacteria bacterium]MBI3092678.1 NGG1p interacting factor NIF3 [Candidatus Levybacteria bacterium]